MGMVIIIIVTTKLSLWSWLWAMTAVVQFQCAYLHNVEHYVFLKTYYYYQITVDSRYLELAYLE